MKVSAVKQRLDAYHYQSATMVETAIANDSRKWNDIQSLITKVNLDNKVAIVTGKRCLEVHTH